ncbi:MAG: 50S ribosomal protein L24 [SAR202 cluster bacterium]|nr:50S ribosomal protein L24 [SAR202 cluster bacterium]
MRIRTGDNVLVIAGKEKGKTGRVERRILDKDRVIVEGVNMVTKHMKARPGVSQSGRIQKEGSIHASNVVLICNKCNTPTRPKTIFLDTGSRVRSCTKCQEVIDDAR